MKKVLITGASGFIGFHLALFLKRKGIEVVGFDNFNHYYDPQLKRAREKILDSQGVLVIEGDICQKNLIKNLIEERKLTHVIHLAAQAGIRYSLKHPEEYIKSNIEGFFSVLEALKTSPHVKLIFASSSSVYGNNSKIPFHEDDPTDNPANLYGATKKSNEIMARSYHNIYKIPMIGLRFFTVYGPWGRPDMAYYHFASQIMQGNSLSVFHNGIMKRDFTYIDDIIDGIDKAIEFETDFEIFNLGNSQPLKVNTLIEILENNLGKKALIRFLPMQKGEALTTYADITKAKKKLGYEPKTSLKRGVEHFIKWHLEYHQTILT